MKNTTLKLYECSQCGHQEKKETNHFGQCQSWREYNVCPKCPPFKKYPWYGGQTIWICKEAK